MNLEEFKNLDAETQRQVLAERNQRIRRAMEEAAETAILEATLVPAIPVRKTTALPPVPNRDEAVRRLMAADSSIREIQTADGVIYRR